MCHETLACHARHRARLLPLLQHLHPLRHTNFVRFFRQLCILRRRSESDLENLDTGIEFLLLRRVVIEMFLKLARPSPLQQLVTKCWPMAHSEVVTKWRNAPSCLIGQLFLLSPFNLQKPHFVPHQVLFLSWVELRRRARAHRNPCGKSLRGATRTTNIARATVARFRLRPCESHENRIFHTQQTLIEQQSDRQHGYEKGTAHEDTYCLILSFFSKSSRRAGMRACLLSLGCVELRLRNGSGERPCTASEHVVVWRFCL